MPCRLGSLGVVLFSLVPFRSDGHAQEYIGAVRGSLP